MKEGINHTPLPILEIVLVPFPSILNSYIYSFIQIPINSFKFLLTQTVNTYANVYSVPTMFQIVLSIGAKP